MLTQLLDHLVDLVQLIVFVHLNDQNALARLCPDLQRANVGLLIVQQLAAVDLLLDVGQNYNEALIVSPVLAAQPLVLDGFVELLLHGLFCCLSFWRCRLLR